MHPDELLGPVGREPEDLEASRVQHHELPQVVVGRVDGLTGLQVGRARQHLDPLLILLRKASENRDTRGADVGHDPSLGT